MTSFYKHSLFCALKINKQRKNSQFSKRLRLVNNLRKLGQVGFLKSHLEWSQGSLKPRPKPPKTHCLQSSMCLPRLYFFLPNLICRSSQVHRVPQSIQTCLQDIDRSTTYRQNTFLASCITAGNSMHPNTSRLIRRSDRLGCSMRLNFPQRKIQWSVNTV